MYRHTMEKIRTIRTTVFSFLLGMLFFNATAWAVLPIAVPGVLSLHGAATGTIYAVTSEPGGLYRFTEGVGWTQVALTLPNTYFSMVTIAPKGTLYGAGLDGLFRSSDDGQTWRNTQTEEQVFFLINLTEGALLARTWKKGLLRSDDHGASWYPVGTEMHEGHVSDLLQEGNGTVWAATFGGGMYRSTDAGVTWSKSGLDQQAVLALATDAQGILYAGTYHEGVYRHDTLGWKPINLGLPEQATVQKIGVTPTALVASVAHHGLYVVQKTGTGSGEWVPVGGEPAGIEEITGILPAQGGQCWVATRPQGLFRVNLAHPVWVPVPLSVSVQMAAADSCGGTYAVLSEGGLWHTAGHTTWHTTGHSSGGPSPSCGSEQKYFGQVPERSDVFHVTHTGTLLIGGTNGLFLHHAIQKNGTTEETWRKLLLQHADSAVTCLTETTTAWIVGTRTDGLFRSSDDGVTWVPLAERGAVRDCVATGGTLYVATNAGLSVSSEGGTAWTRYPLSPAPTRIVPDGERGVIIAGETASGRGLLMESTHGAPPTLLPVEGIAGGSHPVRTMAVSGNILYTASTQGIDLFQREGTVWHWEGQVLPQVTATNLTALLNDRVAVAGNRGLFLLHGVDDALQIPITNSSY